MKPQPFLSLTDLPGLFAEADKCASMHDYDGAIQVLQRAQKLHPTVDRVMVKLGDAYANAYDFSAAERCFEDGVRLSPTKAGALTAVGHHWLEVRNYEAARHCFERVLEQNDVSIAILVRLQEIYLRLHRKEDAAKTAERAEQLHPGHEGTLLIRARMHRQNRQLADAEKLLRQAAAKSDADVQARSIVWYELGAVLDQQGRYDDAMSAFLEAKALLNLLAVRPTKIWRTKEILINQMRQQIAGNLLDRWRKVGATEFQPPRKLALLCGKARSGTTLLEYVLDSHPQIVSADETSVFKHKTYCALSRNLSPTTSLLSALDALTPRNLRQIRADYFRGTESFLGQPIGERLLVDKNPALTMDIPAVIRVFPECKFLVALRDPRDVCLSCFMQPAPLVADTVSWLTLEGLIDQYALIMGLWLALKPHMAGNAIEVRYESMVENLESTARPVLGFLGAPWDERVLRFHETASSKIVRSPTYVEVTKPIFKSSMGRWKNYQKYFEPHLAKLAPFLQAFGYE